MKEFRITYQPFSTSTMQVSDIIIPARDEAEAERIFKETFPGLFFVSAEEE